MAHRTGAGAAPRAPSRYRSTFLTHPLRPVGFGGQLCTWGTWTTTGVVFAPKSTDVPQNPVRPAGLRSGPTARGARPAGVRALNVQTSRHHPPPAARSGAKPARSGALTYSPRGHAVRR